MNCKKVQRLLPLMVGSELSQSKISAVKSHLKKCSRCQHECDMYVLSLEKAKELLARDKKDWEEIEWKRAIQKALRIKEPPTHSPLVPWRFKNGWALALMASVILILFLFVVQPSFIKEKIGFKDKAISGPRMQPAGILPEMCQQEMISMIMVSKETGLKIVWFFNKNFELEEVK